MNRLRTRPGPVLIRRVSLLAVVLLAVIVVTGAAVRLTGSGLGCPTWPSCTSGSLVNTPAYGVHGLVEFGNRMVTLAVFVVVVVLPVLTVRARPRRPDLVWPSLGLVAGYLGQAVLGGLSVLLDLSPVVVAAHYLLSMVLLVDALVLHRRACAGPGQGVPAVPIEVVWLVRGLAAAAAAVLVAGTAVTGAGPHSGGSLHTARLTLTVGHAAQLHTDVALLLTGLLVATLVALRVVAAPPRMQRTARVLLAGVLAQIVLGGVQYALAVPVGLVAVHVALATLVWILAVRLVLLSTDRLAITASTSATRGAPVRAGG